MTPRQRAAELAAIRARLRYSRPAPIPFPDLSCNSAAAPLSNTIPGASPKRQPLPEALALPVGHCHKQGPQLITPGMIANGELANLGGQKR